MNTAITGEFSQSETRMCFVSGGHRHIISPFYAVLKESKRSVGSHTFRIGDHSWQIVCYPGGETPDVKDWISLFLGYRGPDKECLAHWRLTLINQTDGSQNRTRAWLKGDKFNKFMTGRRWGWQRFIKREDLMNPGKGFIKDGKVIFEASLDVFIKQTLTMVCQDKFEFSLYPIPASQIQADFQFLFNNGNIDPEDNESPGILADVKFLLSSGKVQYAHSQILSSRSPVFFKLFTSTFKEVSDSRRIVEIHIAGISYETFLETLRYIYTGKVNWNSIRQRFLTETQKRTSNAFLRKINEHLPVVDFEPPKKKKREDSQLLTSVNFCNRDSNKVNSYQTKLNLPKKNVGNEGYENMDQDKITRLQNEMAFLKFSLSLYEAADKYELNRLRLISEHTVLSVLRDQINRINRDVMYSQSFMNPAIFNTSYGNVFQFVDKPSRRYEINKSFENSLEVQQRNEEMWCNGFLDVLAIADRHNSRKLKRLCFSALTSDVLCKKTKQILLSKPLLETLSKDLITEMLQFVTIREQRTTDEEAGVPEFGVLGGVPEGGNELLNVRETEGIETQESREPCNMPEADLKSELVERGLPVRGNRAVLISRLEQARSMNLIFDKDNEKHERLYIPQ